MDSLDKSQTNLQHRTKKIKNMVKSKCFKISIGLCIMFTLVVTVGFIIKLKINSNNELRNEQTTQPTTQETTQEITQETTQQTPKEHKDSKYKYKYLVFNNCT